MRRQRNVTIVATLGLSELQLGVDPRPILEKPRKIDQKIGEAEHVK
jgi:hypothetical protein